MVISAWWNLASSKLKKEENSTGKLGNRQLLSEFGFVLRIAPPSLSRDRKVKMKKSINHLVEYTAIRVPIAIVLKLFYLMLMYVMVVEITY